jgi:hypothetical protein
VLVNINKLKPYKFNKNKSFQPTLVKLGDLIIDEHFRAKEPIPLLVEPKDFQPIGFEPISNHLTPNNIKTTCVFVHHYHNLPIQDNNVIVSNDPTDMFRKSLIDVYLLGVFKLKGYVHSKP